MKSIQLALMFFLIYANAPKGQGQGWLRSYDKGYVSKVAADDDGGYLFIWNELPNTSEDSCLLVKTDPLGEIIWSRKIPYTFYGDTDLFITESGEIVVTLSDVGDRWVMFFNSNGDKIWEKKYSSSITICDVGIDTLLKAQGGNLYIKIERMNYQGDVLWSKNINAEYLNKTLDVIEINDNSIVVAAAFVNSNLPEPVYLKLIKVNLDGDLIWEKVIHSTGFYYQKVQIEQDTLGNFFAITPFSDSTILIKADPQGETIWSKTLRNNLNQPYVARGICRSSDGNLILGGEYFNSIEMSKIDPDGNLIFTKYFDPGAGIYPCYDVTNTLDGGYLLGGSIYPNLCLLIKTDANGNIYPNFITGKVAFDQNHNCQIGANEPPLKNWTVVATETSGQEYYATTNDTGFYELNVNLGNYAIEIHPPNALWEPCDDQFNADLSIPSDTVNLDFPVQDSVLCSLLDVSVSTLFLRRCFDSQYFVSWCNLGTTAAFNAFIEIVLPPELDFVSASQAVSQVGDTLRFDLGTVGFSECGELNFKVNVNCDSTDLGQTLCVEARIFPDTVCYETQNWSGARVVATARCLADTAVEFRLHNVGDAPTQMLDYIITEDLVVLMQGDFNLAPGEEKIVLRDANGTTQRLEAEQEPGYPFASFSSATIEGCGNAPFSFGFVNQFSLDDASPFTDIECREVVGSYDPNDKQGFPNGYGNQHFIEPGTDITYLIRFQNTGTDTAFFVTIRDTLSAWLDPASVRPGAASHPYTWELTGPGALAFRFDNIFLPDSNVNEAASHGFVQFRISQRADVPLNTVIENDAAIFFDYNAPVITNTTFHTVDLHFYTVSVENEPGFALLAVKVSPNPFRERAVISLPETLPGEATFRLFDQAGSAVRRLIFSGNTLELSAKDLPSGLYFFEIQDDKGQIRSRGKMVVN